MAVKPCEEIIHPFRATVKTYKWSNLENGDTGTPLNVPYNADKTVQVYGTFGVGGHCKIEGANDFESPVFDVLSDHRGDDLDLTEAKIALVAENPFWIRPNISAGDGTTDITIIVTVK